MRKTVLVVGSMAWALLLASVATVLTASAGRRQAADGDAGRRGRYRQMRRHVRPQNGKACGQNTGNRLHPRRPRLPTTAPARSSATATIPPGASTRTARGPPLATTTIDTAGAKPYFNYFRWRAGRPRGYYSYDRGAWHIVALNSNCKEIGGCGRWSAQGRWLRRDLNHHRARCTLAYFHHPFYASGRGEDSPEVKPFWHILYNHHADVILSGHAHRYERFALHNPEWGTFIG